MTTKSNNVLADPTEEMVEAACKEFDQGDDVLIEGALTDLFRQHPDNGNHHQVLVKVLTLNELYSTRLHRYSPHPTIMEMAAHIFRNHAEIDRALACGDSEAVEIIARRQAPGYRRCLSFASKYASWHKSELYPIYDSRVEKYVDTFLKSQPRFAEFFHTGEDDWKYAEFRRLISLFREAYGLTRFTFKQLDKFLFLEGGKLLDMPKVPKPVPEAAERERFKQVADELAQTFVNNLNRNAAKGEEGDALNTAKVPKPVPERAVNAFINSLKQSARQNEEEIAELRGREKKKDKS